MAGPAQAHEEREATFPDGTGDRPTYLGLDNARHRVVCRPDSRERINAMPRSALRKRNRTIRQVRYADRGTLVYAFHLANGGRLPMTVTGLAPLEVEPRLFDYVGVTDAHGAERFTIPAGERVRVEVSMLMHACETLSARAGSFATEVALHTQRAGVVDDVVTVPFPEEVHTGSPREVFCPNATATSRPPG